MIANSETEPLPSLAQVVVAVPVRFQARIRTSSKGDHGGQWRTKATMV
jgi:hypothetical protein